MLIVAATLDNDKENKREKMKMGLAFVDCFCLVKNGHSRRRGNVTEAENMK